jgi:hypothetical protein
MLTAVLTWRGIAHRGSSLKTPPGSRSRLVVGQRHHHPAVRHVATAADTVRLTVRGVDRPDRIDLYSAGSSTETEGFPSRNLHVRCARLATILRA